MTAHDPAAPIVEEQETLPEPPERVLDGTDGPVLVYSWAPLIPIDSIAEHPENPNEGNDALVRELVERHGFRGEVEVQASTRYVVVGNTRLRVMRSLGVTEIPASIIELTDREARERLLSDNRARDVARQDEELAAALLQEMSEEPQGLLGTGYDDATVGNLLAPPPPLVRQPSRPPLPRPDSDGNFLGSEIRQLVLVMGVVEFERAVAVLAIARTRLEVGSNSEAIIALIEEWAASEGVEPEPAEATAE
jgi:hypothetical protein